MHDKETCASFLCYRLATTIHHYAVALSLSLLVQLI
uniref:Uncharacterized protein n=1 Tax=Anguilla anguilla TaxID=7936 RepID=A0A0E9U0E4_ANGAN